LDVSVYHPTDRPNFCTVTVGKIQIYFSYETPIAFRHAKTGFVVRENDWGPTTGKHLNHISSKEQRISGEEFTLKLKLVLDDEVIHELPV
jgi:hypothetical protein